MGRRSSPVFAEGRPVVFVINALVSCAAARLFGPNRADHFRSFLVGAVALGLLPAVPVSAQILLSSGSYTQNFDSLAISGSPPWTDNSTLPGWYASKSASPNAVTNYLTGAGAANTGAIYSFGDSGSGERALGSIGSGTPGNFAYGVRFTNDTPSAQSNFVVSYTGEEWRVADAALQTLSFSYRVGTQLTNADAPNSQAWTAFPALSFTSPNTGTNATALKGNDPTNRVAFANVLLTNVVLQPGDELFLRWFDPNDGGFDDALAVDDLTVTFSSAGSNTNEPPPENPVAGFTLVHYNVKGNGASDWSTNAAQVQAIARELIYLNPDIITFNEIPNGLRYEMTNWMTAFFPGYKLAVSSGTDGFIRSAIVSRFSITRSNAWLDGADLDPYGYTNANFTRDLFEAEIAVPGFPQPLHVFTTHLKSGTTSSDDNARRAAEAMAISNYFVTGFLTTNSLQPYLLTGDLNEDVDVPPGTTGHPIQTLTNGTGLHLTTPLNPVTLSRLTHSIQGSLDRRFDYIMPNGLLLANISTSQVFRTDVLTNLPPTVLTNDDIVASDHLPVLMVFNNPYDKPFRLVSIARSNAETTVRWESIFGQPYRVDWSTNLFGWAPLASNIVATDAITAFTTNAIDDTRFFRVFRTP